MKHKPLEAGFFSVFFLLLGSAKQNAEGQQWRGGVLEFSCISAVYPDLGLRRVAGDEARDRVREVPDRAGCNSRAFRNAGFSGRIHRCLLQGFVPTLDLFVRDVPAHNPAVFLHDLCVCGDEQRGGEGGLGQGIQTVPFGGLLALVAETCPEWR